MDAFEYDENGEPIRAMGTGAVIPMPGHPEGKKPGEIIGVRVTVENFTHPEEALLALMLFGSQFAKDYEAGNIAAALDQVEGLPLGTPVEVSFGDEGPSPRLCEEHAAEVAEKFGEQIADGAEKFLRELAGD